MVEFKAASAKMFFIQGFKIIVKKDNQIISQGTIKTNPEIANLLLDSSNSFFVPRSKGYKFLKHLAGQVLIGYFICWVFALISVSFLILLPQLNSKGLIVLAPLDIMCILISFYSYFMAKKAQKRITKSLNKKKI